MPSILVVKSLIGTRAYVPVDLGRREESILDRICSEMAGSDLYAGDVKAWFDAVVLMLIRFVSDRANQGGSVFPYLRRFEDRRDMPKERELQIDLRGMLIGTWRVPVEETGVAAGRADLRLPVQSIDGSFNFTIEIKRFENKRWSESKTGKWLGQGAAYYQNDVPLGFMGILDLSVRKPGQPSLSDCFSVRTLRISHTDVRKVVVFRVPGNLRAPSSA
jgi:hypothetical protein